MPQLGQFAHEISGATIQTSCGIVKTNNQSRIDFATGECFEDKNEAAIQKIILIQIAELFEISLAPGRIIKIFTRSAGII